MWVVQIWQSLRAVGSDDDGDGLVTDAQLDPA